MQSRPNTFIQRGGDTTVLEHLSRGLSAAGVEVCVDVAGEQDPRGFDIVHLFNFATPQLTQELAQRAMQVGIPYVVTTLYEDVSEFHNQSHHVAQKAIEYVLRGQPKGEWSMSAEDIINVSRCRRFAADAIAANAAALFPNGSGEASSLRRDFPDSKRIIEIPVGHEIELTSGPDLFRQRYGIADFVLCVGRLESRKNQLMLLKALEDSELTVVLAAGGFSYQPDYAAAVRSFRRRGTTVVLDRLEPDMLSSAYAACRVHALPSWYELPGLVSLEAAAHGKNIVVTRTGTTADYVGDKAFFCTPWDCDSIESAVTAAFYAPTKDGLVEMARGFTWDEAVRRSIKAYNEVLGRSEEKTTRVKSSTMQSLESVSHGVYDMSINATEFQDALERGEIAAKSHDFTKADELLRQAESMNPASARVLKARGAVLLAQMKADEAQSFFDRALLIEPNDAKVLAGRGMCDLARQRPDRALPFFEKAISLAPDYLVALHQLLECSYALSSFDRAVTVLERYLSIKPEDVEIRYCYAGCLYKTGQVRRAIAELDRVLEERPDHQGAQELRVFISNAATTDLASHPIEESPTNAPEAMQPSSLTGTTGSELRDSLADLSAKIRGWRIGAPTNPQSMMQTECTEEERVAIAIGEIEGLKREGDFTKALKQLDELLSGSSLPVVHQETARCLEAEFAVLAGDFARATTMYDAILANNPRSARALCGKGALAAEGQDWSSARGFFNQALMAQPNHDIALAGLGLCEMVSNNAEQAFALFQRSVEANPENHRALLGVLQTGYPLKKYTEMERMISAYLDLHPGSVDMLYSFAGVLFAQGKVKEARLEVEKILVFEPEHEHALELRGMLDNPGSVSKTAVTQ
jgi:tetratricopeptide (TPR) repeat protein